MVVNLQRAHLMAPLHVCQRLSPLLVCHRKVLVVVLPVDLERLKSGNNHACIHAW
jgi:hypothetical protein